LLYHRQVVIFLTQFPTAVDGDTTADDSSETTGDDTSDTTGDDTSDTTGDDTSDTTGDDTTDDTTDDAKDAAMTSKVALLLLVPVVAQLF